MAHVPAPYGQALTLALLEVAAAYDGPPRVAGKDPPGRLHLVVEIGEASETRKRAEDLHERFELQRVDVPAVEGDVPSTREDEARARRRIVEHRLGRSRRVAVDASGGHHDEDHVASRDSALDDLAVVGRSGDDSDAPLECVELPNALLAAHSNHLVTAIQALLDHVLPKLPRSPDDAHFHLFLPSIDRRQMGLHSGHDTRKRTLASLRLSGRPQCSGVSEGLPAFGSSFTILRADMKRNARVRDRQ